MFKTKNVSFDSVVSLPFIECYKKVERFTFRYEYIFYSKKIKKNKIVNGSLTKSVGKICTQNLAVPVWQYE